MRFNFTAFLLGLVATAMTSIAFAYEEPPYAVLAERDGYEIREYAEYLVAETTVQADFDASGNIAFPILAGYIFGDNAAQEKMAMTTPVTRHPVADDKSGGDAYRYGFVMERKYTAESLPEPLDSRVATRAVPPRIVAARRYSGRTNEANFQKNRRALLESLQRDGVEATGEAVSAVYNGPFTLPFLRRNEVLVEVAFEP